MQSSMCLYLLLASGRPRARPIMTQQHFWPCALSAVSSTCFSQAAPRRRVVPRAVRRCEVAVGDGSQLAAAIASSLARSFRCPTAL